jgi:hypothetical protein
MCYHCDFEEASKSLRRKMSTLKKFNDEAIRRTFGVSLERRERRRGQKSTI